MSFAAPALLIGLFAALIPVLIHLLNRRRHRTIKWAAMQFLLKATQESRGAKKLKHIAILACRALAVATIIFAIAKPVVSGLLGWGGGHIDTVVLLLDRSASMEASEGESEFSKRDYVLSRISSSMEELGGAKLILIDSATLEAQEVPSPDVLGEITATQATATSANIPAMLAKAAEYIQSTDPGRTEIWLASDQQRSSWAPQDGRWESASASIQSLPQGTRVRVLSLRGMPARNLSIQLISARRLAGELILDLNISRLQGRGTLTVPITYNLDGSSFAETLSLTGQTLRFQKRFDLQGKKDGGHGFVEITSDSNLQDNTSFFTYTEDQPTLSAIVTESAQADSSRALRLVSAPPGYGSFESQIYTPGSAKEIDWNGIATLIWQGAFPDGDLSEQIATFVRSGGTALFLPPLADSEVEFQGLKWSELQRSPGDQFFIVEDWERDSGPLADGIDSTPLPVGRHRAIQRRAISGELTTLGLWEDTSLFLGRRVMEKGTLYALSTLPDYEWSNLADADVLLPLTQRLIQQGSQRLTGAGSFPAGSSRAFPLAKEDITQIDTIAEFKNPGLEAGIYRYGERTLAINRPTAEDDWELLDEAESRDLLDGINATVFEQSIEAKESLVQQIWRSFLIATLLFLIAEAILCLQPKSESASRQLA